LAPDKHPPPPGQREHNPPAAHRRRHSHNHHHSEGEHRPSVRQPHSNGTAAPMQAVRSTGQLTPKPGMVGEAGPLLVREFTVLPPAVLLVATNEQRLSANTHRVQGRKPEGGPIPQHRNLVTATSGSVGRFSWSCE